MPQYISCLFDTSFLFAYSSSQTESQTRPGLSVLSCWAETKKTLPRIPSQTWDEEASRTGWRTCQSHKHLTFFQPQTRKLSPNGRVANLRQCYTTSLMYCLFRCIGWSPAAVILEDVLTHTTEAVTVKVKDANLRPEKASECRPEFSIESIYSTTTTHPYCLSDTIWFTLQ